MEYTRSEEEGNNLLGVALSRGNPLVVGTVRCSDPKLNVVFPNRDVALRVDKPLGVAFFDAAGLKVNEFEIENLPGQNSRWEWVPNGDFVWFTKDDAGKALSQLGNWLGDVVLAPAGDLLRVPRATRIDEVEAGRKRHSKKNDAGLPAGDSGRVAACVSKAGVQGPKVSSENALANLAFMALVEFVTYWVVGRYAMARPISGGFDGLVCDVLANTLWPMV